MLHILYSIYSSYHTICVYDRLFIVTVAVNAFALLSENSGIFQLPRWRLTVGPFTSELMFFVIVAERVMSSISPCYPLQH